MEERGWRMEEGAEKGLGGWEWDVVEDGNHGG